MRGFAKCATRISQRPRTTRKYGLTILVGNIVLIVVYNKLQGRWANDR